MYLLGFMKAICKGHMIVHGWKSRFVVVAFDGASLLRKASRERRVRKE